MHEEKALFDKLLQTAVILCTQSIEDEDMPGEIFVDGTSNILTKSDFADLERLLKLRSNVSYQLKMSGSVSGAGATTYSLKSTDVGFGMNPSARPANLARFASDPQQPTRQHIHVVVRTPNGNDYGKDLLRQHYELHPHTS